MSFLPHVVKSRQVQSFAAGACLILLIWFLVSDDAVSARSSAAAVSGPLRAQASPASPASLALPAAPPAPAQGIEWPAGMLPHTKNVFLQAWSHADFAAAGASLLTFRSNINASIATWEAAGFPTVHPEREQPVQFAALSAAPAAVPCAPLTRYGGSPENPALDGSKFICALPALAPGCTVVSLGSNNDFSFEEAILAATPCDVRTYDCTVDGSTKPATPRSRFERRCIGPATGDPANVFKPLESIAAEFGHGAPGAVTLLKFDCEGCEYRIVDAWLDAMIAAGGTSALALPDQISFELHSYHQGLVPGAYWDVRVIFPKLVDLGFVVIAREDNARCFLCVEYTMMRAFVVEAEGAAYAYRHKSAPDLGP